MAKCDLQIVFDRPDRTYKIGEKITGAIRVRVAEDCEGRKLTIARQWRVSGQGEIDQGTVEGEQVIFTGGWPAGQAVAYPFEIDAPPGPLTYHGSLFNVDWHIRAAAEVPGTVATASENFVLLAGASSEDVRMGTLDAPPRQATGLIAGAPVAYSGGCSQLFAALFGAVALFVGLPCLAVGVLNLITIFIPASLPISIPTGPLQSIFLIIMGGLFTLLGGRAIVTLLQGARARSMLGPVQIEVNPTTARRGESVTCTVRLQPRRAIELTEATANLVATEHVLGRGGNADSETAATWKQVIHQSSASLAPEQTIRPLESTLLTATLNLPLDAPCTFWGKNNKLVWTVSTTLKLKGWPDWTRTFPITIRPRLARDSRASL